VAEPLAFFCFFIAERAPHAGQGHFFHRLDITAGIVGDGKKSVSELKARGLDLSATEIVGDTGPRFVKGLTDRFECVWPKRSAIDEYAGFHRWRPPIDRRRGEFAIMLGRC
jgi:hypothetical protein